MTGDDELWGYDEPHQSGGNAHITMTKRQAIDWFKSTYCSIYNMTLPSDEDYFNEWVVVNWASKEEKQHEDRRYSENNEA